MPIRLIIIIYLFCFFLDPAISCILFISSPPSKFRPMNICVISNFTKTYLYDKIAQSIAKEGIQTYWIAVNQNLYQFLVERYGTEKVLLINKKRIVEPRPAIGEFKINELIYGDRVLKHYPNAGYQYLQNIQQPIYDFLKANNIRFTFGETTWAHEVLIHRMCKSCKALNCQHLDLHSVRIPYKRFAFFPEEGQGNIHEVNQKENWTGQIIKAKKPDYAKIFDTQMAKASSITGRLNRLKRFITNENIDTEDPCLLSNPLKRLKTCSLEEWRKEAYKKIKRYAFKEVSHQPYVFIGLHVQPEASVDVFGRYYEDQLQNIKNIWRALPNDWLLLVKEHSNAIGNRSPKFYEEVAQLPNVKLIKETTNSYEIIQKAELVVTITGTLSYEAALMGIPSLTFVPMFFNRLNRCKRITLEDLSQYNLKEIATELKQLPNNVEAFSSFLYQNTFEGDVIDPLTNESVLDEGNIANIAKAMILTLNSSFSLV